MKFRTSRSSALLQPFHFNKESKVQAQFAYDCDINNIVAGMTSPMPINENPISDEVKVFSPDMYEQALYTKATAENAFMQLPSNVRTFFDNNPGKMLSFISDPKNTDKCIELGLMSRKTDDIKELNANLKNFNDSLNIGIKNPTETVETVTPQGSQGA